MARNSVWRYGLAVDFAFAPYTTGNLWGGLSSKFMIGMVTGETLMRSRINWYLTFGVSYHTGSTVHPADFWFQNMQILCGLWGDKNASSSTGPPSPNTSSEDPGFIQWAQMAPTHIRQWTTVSGNEIQEITFSFNAEVSDSRGRRGPWTTTGGLWIAWNFFSTSAFYTQHTSGANGYIGGSCALACNILEAA